MIGSALPPVSRPYLGRLVAGHDNSSATGTDVDADVGQVDEHQTGSLDSAQPRRLACELAPVEEDHRFADDQFLGYLTDRCQGGRWQPVEQVIGNGGARRRAPPGIP
jgi:hypothetical protein